MTEACNREAIAYRIERDGLIQTEPIAISVGTCLDLVNDSRRLATLEAEHARLAALVEWRTIDTAPKDTDVLVFAPARDGRDSQCVVANSGERGKYWH